MTGMTARANAAGLGWSATARERQTHSSPMALTSQHGVPGHSPAAHCRRLLLSQRTQALIMLPELLLCSGSGWQKVRRLTKPCSKQQRVEHCLGSLKYHWKSQGARVDPAGVWWHVSNQLGRGRVQLSGAHILAYHNGAGAHAVQVPAAATWACKALAQPRQVAPMSHGTQKCSSPKTAHLSCQQRHQWHLWDT